MTCDREIEDALGIFDISLSYSSDGRATALSLAEYCRFYQMRCYDYEKYLAQQAGFDIWRVMDFVYRTSGTVIIINSFGYLKTEATRYEMEVARRRKSTDRTILLDLGGDIDVLAGGHVLRYQNFSNDVAIEIMRHAKMVKEPARSVRP